MRWSIVAALVLVTACAKSEVGADSVAAGVKDTSQPLDLAIDSGMPPATPPVAATPTPPAAAPVVSAPRRDTPVVSTEKGRIVMPRAPRDESGNPEVQRLEARARALVRATGCSSAGDCRAAPVGQRGCGGPRTYFVYCRTATDSAALFRVLAELERAERAYNARSGMASTCEFREAPAVGLEGGRCVAR